MKIIGMLALNRFPHWMNTYSQLHELCSTIFVRYDGPSGDPSFLKTLKAMMDTDKKLKTVNIVQGPWQCPEWREECLAMVHDEKPDIILCPDEDELFENTEEFKKELEMFYRSDKGGMMFEYNPLVTRDGTVANQNIPYPPDPHMKAFKWREGISYFPYHGNGIPGYYGNTKTHWKATTKINHYCAYTGAMREAKHWRSDTVLGRANKCVTLIGFGPSSEVRMNVTGEVWSLNNCYQVFMPELLKRTTRIFEMHQFAKREKEMAKDGKPHFWHLNELGKLGHRIIMQAPHPQITNSECYPLNDILGHLQFRYFDGTPCYLLAQAIHEGYTEIRVYGFDQLDWEHRLQRECFVFWVGVAAGMGITVSGELTFLNESKRLYGYDYGPEFDDECKRRLYSAWPFEISMKEPSRAQKGELFNGR